MKATHSFWRPAARRLLSRFPQLPNALTFCAFLYGAVWRWLHVTQWHDPRQYVYSDMKMYVDLGKRLAQPDYVLRPHDVTHPPGTGELIAWFYERDPDLSSLVHFQAAVSILVPLVLGALAIVAFDRTTARAAVVISSLYFPFIDYAGYFLAEIYIVILVPLCLTLYLAATRQSSWKRAAPFALAAGAVLSLALAMKMVALPAILGFAILHWLFRAESSRRLKTVALVALLLGATPGSAAMSRRCTEANGGELCFGSNKSSADLLLGHYGRIQGIKWKDPKQRGYVSFGSPSAYQHGYRDVREVPFSITDGEKNSEAAWDWIRKRKMHALVLSFEHVFDTMGATLPWPAVATKYWVGSQGAQYLFLVFLLFPAAVRCLDLARDRGLWAMLQSRELSVISPLFGVMLAVFVATGEPRYRIPFDGLVILVAIQFYRNYRRPARDAGTDDEASADQKNPPAAGAAA